MFLPDLIPTKKPTPSEYVVLIFFVAFIFIIIGIIALIVGFRAPIEKHDLAVALEHRGFWMLGIGVAILFACWLYRRLAD